MQAKGSPHSLELSRQRCSRFHNLPGAGVLKAKPMSVKRLPHQEDFIFFRLQVRHKVGQT
jgi:hypothetical protein